MGGASDNCRLAGAPFKVAVCILQHANEGTERAWPSYKTIAARTKLAVPTVKLAVKEIVRTGWIEKRTVRGPDGKLHNIYKILWQNVQEALDDIVAARAAKKAERAALLESESTWASMKVFNEGV